MRISDILNRLISANAPNCPNEANVLAYYENRLPAANRARMERHFVDCDDCRQVLAFLGHEIEPTGVSAEVVSQQTARVLAYIEMGERNRSKSPELTPSGTSGFFISYPRLAAVGLIIGAIIVGSVFIITRDQAPADAAMASLRRGLKTTRLSEARISGGFDHSRYVGTTRGTDTSNDDLHLSHAENKVKAAAEKETAEPGDRLVLARVYLARGTREGAHSALAILNPLLSSGVETSEVLNDTGVAYFQLDKYEDAIAFFHKALAKNAGYHEALFNLALAEGLVHRNVDARRNWQKFIDQSPDEKWKAEARNRLNSLPGTGDP